MASDSSEDRAGFAPRCLSIDLEVGRHDGRIHRFAAIRGDTQEKIEYHGGDLQKALVRLDALAAGAAFVLGHNLIAHDNRYLSAAKPDLRLLELPQVDTLRLSPLAFPRNPYHRLVKHYQDARIRRGQRNDPELDARLTLELFSDQCDAFRSLHRSDPDLLLAWHWLTTEARTVSGLSALFSTLRRHGRPSPTAAVAVIRSRLRQSGCATHVESLTRGAEANGWPLAYVLAWLSVAGGNSVVPPWVRHTFPEVSTQLRQLRDTPCASPHCDWCREHHDSTKALCRWFGYSSFRAEPRGEDGAPLQQSIVDAAMRREHVLGILPTGTGKSVCYQLPALSRYEKTGALTLVISPLVALMADQVAQLEARGITACAAVNGLLSMPERADVLDRVRLGDVAILITSPEQLRNRSVRSVLEQREIAAWVLDEAHCLSEWGHDFRPDYRYVARFIKESAKEGELPPVLCLTATAKPDVIDDIVGHFRKKLGIELRKLNGGTERANLDFAVVPTTPATKLADIDQLLRTDLAPEAGGGAIVYCATRRQTEEVAEFLRERGIPAEHFHAGLPPETKKSVQTRFIAGELPVIVATNAFGMGIDKSDVRLVLHADTPGSLESYLQEAGRAGRDGQPARCVLLYSPEDVERQFRMSARSRLTHREIRTVLRALRRLGKRQRVEEVVATPGEILAEDPDGEFGRDSASDDTRVRTAVSWLEESSLLTREENAVQLFPASLRVATVEEAAKRLEGVELQADYRRGMLSIVERLIDADPTKGVTTDELMGRSGFTASQVQQALYDLERLGIASNDTVMTAFLHAGVERSSKRRLDEAASFERALIAVLREESSESGDATQPLVLNLRRLAQRLRDEGHAGALPERIWRLLRSLSLDGRGEDGGLGSIRMRRTDAETLRVWLQREWRALEITAERRRVAGSRLLDHLLSCLPGRARGTDLLAETTLGDLMAALEADLILKADVRNPAKLLERGLLWLHEQEVLRLGKGLAVFRAAMTIRLGKEKRGYYKADFESLRLHYEEQVAQIHVMAGYAQRGLESMGDALRLAQDYFSLSGDAFLDRWLPGRRSELQRQTTPESWRRIVAALGNPAQQAIVADDREQTNVLVLAGPGSGKTRVLVHRIAYLVRVRRENPRGILALAYNRHAAVEIRRRLSDLIGNEAKGVTVMTCHALAMRIAGVSFENRVADAGDDLFKNVCLEAARLLQGTGLPAAEAESQRERLIGAFRWILVDEYQDVGPEQYELIAALAGRTRDDEDGKLSLFAVGDDDQNIYAFNGASVEFIRRFESDYAARIAYLTDNYRSTAHIIAAANRVIEPARERMKNAHPITVDRTRSDAPAGGRWEGLDAVARGRVQVLPVGENELTQAVAVIQELQRLASLAPDWQWARVAVIAREWSVFEPVRAACELRRIPVQMANEEPPSFWRLRETQALREWLCAEEGPLLDMAALQAWLERQPAGPWWSLLREAAEEYVLETDAAELPRRQFIDWLAEWGREVRRRQMGLMLLTAHRAKGLEFDHVAVLDGGWGKVDVAEDLDASLRLFYVAMTRARETLLLCQRGRTHPYLSKLSEADGILRRGEPAVGVLSPQLRRRHVRPELAEVDLGFGGRKPARDRVHEAIARLAPGDPLRLHRDGDAWALLDANAVVVGRMARRFCPPGGMACLGGRVLAVITRTKNDGDASYLQSYRCARWEVVVPELVFEPVESASAQRSGR